MWKGAIQFGLVTIPVKLYLATETKGVSFNMLHASCGSRIQMKTYCPVDDIYVERSDTVRGFEIAPGQYVTVTDDDLTSVPLKTVRSIELEQFVPLETAGESTRFVKQAYYMEPDPIARKAFYLLKQVLAEKRLRAIGKLVLRDREQLVAIDPFASTMLLSTLYWPDEVRPVADLQLPETEIAIRPAERAMAEQLVATMTRDFDAAEFRDEYREALMGIIEAKAAGAVVSEPAAAPAVGVSDLMAALEASVAAARAARIAARPEPMPAVAAATTAGKRPRNTTRPTAVPVAEEGDQEVAPVRRRKTA
jgi:DNA end-binding protein Ku